ncbi:MAG TPA: MgtC/SapB family protein, partial [Patescibacteria group bacterium]|nr:MgtC/SapB family protein [Patescibacteria group bacterium]
EGLSIRGLTTAASLWVVACLGIAVGLGFYIGAILTTSFILIILIIFSKLEYSFNMKSTKTVLILKSANMEGQINLIVRKLKEYEILYNNISIESDDGDIITLKVNMTNNNDILNSKIIEELNKLQGIKYVQISD